MSACLFTILLGCAAGLSWAQTPSPEPPLLRWAPAPEEPLPYQVLLGQNRTLDAGHVLGLVELSPADFTPSRYAGSRLRELLETQRVPRVLARLAPLLLVLPGVALPPGQSHLVAPFDCPDLEQNESLILTCTACSPRRARLRGVLWQGLEQSGAVLELEYDPTHGVIRRSRLTLPGVTLELRQPGLMPPDPTEDFEGAVHESIERGADHLLECLDGPVQNPPWLHSGSSPMGELALCLLALLRSGVSPEHPAVTAGFQRLERLEMRSTYSVALYLMALEARYTPPEEKEQAREGRLFEVPMRRLPPRDLTRAIEATCFLLGASPAEVHRFSTPRQQQQGPVPTGVDDVSVATTGEYIAEYEGDGNFLWTYQSGISCRVLRDAVKGARRGRVRIALRVPGSYDHSNTQYGVLGLIAARRCGIRIPTRVWEAMILWWAYGMEPGPGPDRQRGGGSILLRHPASDAGASGWGYQRGSHLSYNMTCAGYVALLAARAGMARTPERPLRQALRLALDRARAHLIRTTPAACRSLASNLYGAYGLERVGVLGGLAQLGCDWYHEGSLVLLGSQQPSGGWPGSYGSVVSTSFALLFLSRASTPIVIREPPGPVTTGSDE